MPESGYWYVELVTGKVYVIKVKLVDPDMLHFDECAWIADTGTAKDNYRLSDFMTNGPKPEVSEIESMGPGMFPRGLIAGLWRWGHSMPVTQ